MVYISGGTSLLVPAEIFQHVGIRQGMKVADLGCGAHGHFSIPAARLVGKEGTAYAVDILKSVLQEVSKRANFEGVKNLKTVWSNLEIVGAAKIRNESLDVAMLINILFQSKHHENVMQEAARMLKKGGKLLVVDWRQAHIPFGPPVVDRVDPSDVKKIAKKFGLSLLDEFSAGQFHYGLVFGK